ncbi:DCN1-like protein 1 [Convolutriloba macropyga]|uniref:DCN1-like protein 1 n=1 Tax=Convolutriloba macropyga TaxID=536237 RepID=UPI003F5274D5
MMYRMKNSEKDNLVKQFQSITQVDSKEAREILRKNNWKLDEAMDNFFTNQHRRISSSSATSQRVDRRAIENVFKHYANPQSPDFMLAEEIIRFCGDLSLDPTSLPVLVLAWKFKSKRQCVFTKQEFVEGMYELSCDSLDKLKSYIPHMMSEVESSKSEGFKQLYKFTFGYAKEEGKKNLDIDTATAYWSLLLEKKFIFLSLWKEFLSGADGKKRNTIPVDTWNVTLDFVNQVTSFDQYDTEGAWPTLLDEFVEYARWKEAQERQPQKTTDEQMQID